MVAGRYAGTPGIAGRRGSFRFTWRGAAVANVLEGALQDAMQDVAEEARAEAQSIVHVITGTLKRSIFADVDARGRDGRRTLVVGAHAPYALYEELRDGHAFIRPTVDKISGRLTQRLREAVRSVR